MPSWLFCRGPSMGLLEHPPDRVAGFLQSDPEDLSGNCKPLDLVLQDTHGHIGGPGQP